MPMNYCFIMTNIGAFIINDVYRITKTINIYVIVSVTCMSVLNLFFALTHLIQELECIMMNGCDMAGICPQKQHQVNNLPYHIQNKNLIVYEHRKTL